jgi:ATP-binding protein involved in chromosome partitioning
MNDQRTEVMKALMKVEHNANGKPLLQQRLMRDVVVNEQGVSLSILLTLDAKIKDERMLSKLKEYYQQQVEAALAPLGLALGHLRFREIPVNAPKLSPDTPSPITSPFAKAVHTSQEERDSIKYIAVASGKGGVGKSTVTVNLALALQRAGYAVGIVDADIYGFSIPHMLGAAGEEQDNPDELRPVERYGVYMISTGFFVAGNHPIVWRGPRLGKMIHTFIYEVNWPKLDFMLVDLPPGTGDIALDVKKQLPSSAEIIVTTPHATASDVAIRAGVMAQQTNHRLLGVVENMAYFVDDAGKKYYLFGHGGGDMLANTLGIDVLARIPLVAPSEPDDVGAVTTTNAEIYDELAKKVVKLME